jgi:hypothetical protein
LAAARSFVALSTVSRVARVSYLTQDPCQLAANEKHAKLQWLASAEKPFLRKIRANSQRMKNMQNYNGLHRRKNPAARWDCKIFRQL